MTYVADFPAEYDLSNVSTPGDCFGLTRFTVNGCTVDNVNKKITIDATVDNDFSVRVGYSFILDSQCGKCGLRGLLHH